MTPHDLPAGPELDADREPGVTGFATAPANAPRGPR